MKTTGIEMSREDMITLLSDGTYGSPLEIDFVGDEKELAEFRKQAHEENEVVCIEDLWTDWLLKGGKLRLDANDCYPEDVEDYDEDLVGEFDWARVNEMMNKALNDDEVAWNVHNLMEGEDDFYTGYNLLQYIAFGEVILG